MQKINRIAKLIPAPGLDDRSIDEAIDRGCLAFMLAEIDGRFQYPVYFCTPDDVAYTMKHYLERGREAVVAETGMIIVPVITRETMQKAIQFLCNIGYFDYMKPLTQEQINKRDFGVWPPKILPIRGQS